MSFIAYDITFLVAFTLAVVIFLYIRRSNLKRQGLLYLYRTKIGLEIIDWTSKKFARFLKPLQYVVVISGYLLMAVITWTLVKFTYSYLTTPGLAEALKVPVLTPLVPYIDRLFGPGLLPPFYFTYWIIILALIAIPHEFAHGIFARLNNIKVHSTGFGFLGPFLAAFVEPDEKKMNKAKKFPQLAILAAGTFANILVTIVFGIILMLFFVAAFNPAGVYFNTYSQAIVNISNIQSINGMPLSEINFSLNSSFVEIKSNNKTYFTTPDALNQSLERNLSSIIAFEDSPAFNARLQGAITEINGIKITSQEQLIETISSYSPGDKINIKTINSQGEEKEFNINLAERDGKAYLGIGMIPYQRSGISGIFSSILTSVKNPFVYYESQIGEIGFFIYDLLWWIVIINISVALVNMLPAGIFDGGRFFYLTIWGITRSKKAGEIAFRGATWLIIAVVAALMLKWLLLYV